MSPHQPITLLWLVGLDHVSGMRHGGNLRWFNLSRELLVRGHNVFFAINGAGDHDLAGRVEYLDELKRKGFISGHFVVEYRQPSKPARLSQLLAYHPALLKRLLRSCRHETTRALQRVIAQNQVDALVVDRTFLYVIDTLGTQLPVLIDWVDCFVLYFSRSLGKHLRHGEIRAAVADLRNLIAHAFQERYYGRRATMNLLASPIDKRCLDMVTAQPARSQALPNGVSIVQPSIQIPKDPTRLIFTGNMDFPPNYEAAIWFIDQVLPIIRQRCSKVTFRVAGRNPVPALLSRAGNGVEILGDVPDMSSEIAGGALYVAPLVSGGGFKNKIIEAITCGTFVVSTARGVEFLDPTLRQALLIADSAAEFAGEVCRFLERPELFDGRLSALRQRIAAEYTWSRRAVELLDTLRSC